MNDTEDFALSAQAVLTEAPDYKTGIDTLLDIYNESQFSDPAKAASVLSAYGSALDDRFKANSYNEVAARDVLPVPLSEVEAEDPLERINTWQKLNEDEINKATDADTLISRNKLINTVRRSAISERRKLNGKDSLDDFEARQTATTQDESLFDSTSRKFAGGFLPTVKPLAGYHESEDYYTATNPENSFARNLTEDVAGAAGFVAGIVPTLGTNLVTGIASSVKGAYESGVEQSGSRLRGAGAAGIETASQAAQLLIGGKAVVGVGKRIIGKTLGTLGTEVVTNAGAGALTGLVGGSLSEAASQVGTGDLSVGNIVMSGGRGAFIGGTVGAGAGAGVHTVGKMLAPPADIHKSGTNVIDNVPEVSGPETNKVVSVPGGETEVSPNQSQVAVPFDGTYGVSAEVAAKIDRLKKSVNPEGEPIKIYTDENGRLIVDDPYVDKNLELQNTPQLSHNEQWYHGTANALKDDHFDINMADDEALYGPGIYTTSDPRIASGYAGRSQDFGGGGNSPTVYKLGAKKSNSFDARDGQTIKGAEAAKILKIVAKEYPEFGLEEGDFDIRQYENDPNKEVNAKDLLDQIKEMDGKAVIPEVLKAAGYDSLLHTGGNIKKKGKHDVKVFFNTEDIQHAFTPDVGPVRRTNSNKVVVPTGAGEVAIGANKPRSDETGATVYNSKVLGKSAGSAHIEDLGTKERRFAEKFRTNPLIAAELKSYFGDPEGPGLDRYSKTAHIERSDTASTFINENGLEQAVAHFMSLDHERLSADEMALGGTLAENLFSIYNEAKRAGDTDAAETALMLAGDITAQYSRTGTEAAQTLEIRKLFKNPVQEATEITGALAKQDAVKEVAQETGVPVEDIKKTDKQLQEVNQELDALNKVEDPEIVKTDKDISDAEQIIKEIDTEAETKVKEEQRAIQAKIDQAESEHKQLQESIKQNETAADTQAKQVEEQVKTTEKAHEEQVKKYNETVEANKKKVETDLKTLEEKALSKAQKEKEKRVAAEESTVKKLKENQGKGSKVKPETIAKVEEGIKKEKERKVSAEEGMTPEEKKLYRKLKSDKEKLSSLPKATPDTLIPKPERTKLEKLKTLKQEFDAAKANKGAPKEQARMDALKNFIGEQKKRAASITPESKLGSQAAKRKLKLTEVTKALKEKKQGLVSKLNEQTKKRYDELTGKAKKLKETKAAVAKKTAVKFEERLPQKSIDRLNELVAAKKALPKNAPEQNRLDIEIDKIKHDAASSYKDKLLTFTDRLRSYYLGQMLFRFSTQAFNLAVNTGKLGIKVASYTVTGIGGGRSPLDGLSYLGRFLETTHNVGLGEAKRIFLEGGEPIRPGIKDTEKGLKIKEQTPAKFKLETNEEGEVKSVSSTHGGYEDAVEGISQLPGGSFLKYIGYAFRGLASGDALFSPGAIDAEAHVAAAVAGRKQGLKGIALKKYIGEKLFNSPSETKEALQQAKANAEALKKVGINISDAEVTSNAWAALEKKRAENLRIESIYGAGLDYYRSDVAPRGMLGQFLTYLSDAFSKPLKLPSGKYITNPAGLIQPFTRTLFKAANATIDTTPIGFAKAAVGYRTGESKSVVRTQLGSAIFGTTVMGLAAATLMTQDDEHPWFDITAGLPTDPADKALFYATGKKPWSIKIGKDGGYHSFLWSPLLAPLGIVAIFNDKRKNDKNFDMYSARDVAGVLFAGSFHAFADLSALQMSSGILEAIRTGSDTMGVIENIGASMTKNILLPYNAMMGEISRSYDNPIVTKNNFAARVFSNTPFASMVGKPVLNIWGEPVDRNWYEKIPFVGSTVGRFYGQQTNDPNALWLMNNGYSVVGIENKIRFESTDPKWDITKQSREDRLGLAYGELLTDKEQYQMQKEVGPLYKQIVSQYRSIYGDGKFNPAVQAKLTDELSKAKSRVKYKLFVEGAN